MQIIQRCRKCKTTYQTMSITGQQMPPMLSLNYHLYAKKMCPRCGGDVVWLDENGVPLSREEQLRDARPKTYFSIAFLVLLTLVAISGFSQLVSPQVMIWLVGGILIFGLVTTFVLARK